MPVPSSSGLRQTSRNTLRILAAVGACIWAILIFCVSAIPSEGFPSHPGFLNYLAHFGEYLIFAVLLTIAANGPRRALWLTALIALLIASLYGASDEFHQSFVVGRHPDPLDWLTDTLGALLGAIATIWVISARKVKRSREKDRKSGL
ncbi:MAG: VanZ family protein [Coriobacteriales bacterium]|jgi:VanZ family protein|nr:VanZ family protein [Coriobacteriales bacterium]